MWELIADTEKGKFTDDKEVKKLRKPPREAGSQPTQRRGSAEAGTETGR